MNVNISPEEKATSISEKILELKNVLITDLLNKDGKVNTDEDSVNIMLRVMDSTITQIEREKSSKVNAMNADTNQEFAASMAEIFKEDEEARMKSLQSPTSVEKIIDVSATMSVIPTDIVPGELDVLPGELTLDDIYEPTKKD